MKNKQFIQKKQTAQPVKKKKTLSYYLVLIVMALMLVGSTLGSVAFVRSFADTEYPTITGYVTEEFTDGVDLANNYLYIPKYEEIDIETTYYFESYSFSFDGFTFESLEQNIDFFYDYILVDYTDYIYEDTNNYIILYFDLDLLNSVIDNYNSYESTDYEHISTAIVERLVAETPTVYYRPFTVDSVGIMGSIIGIFTGGIGAIGNGVGSGLSTLASNIFLDSTGGLSVFGSITIIFGGLALAIGLCRLIVSWISSLGGKRV